MKVSVPRRGPDSAEHHLPQGAAPVAAALLAGARPTRQNAFKITLVERTLAAVLLETRDKVREQGSKPA